MLCMFCLLFRSGENIVLYVILIWIGKVRTLIVGIFCLVVAVIAKIQASILHTRKFPRKIHTKPVFVKCQVDKRCQYVFDTGTMFGLPKGRRV
jgi:hypothetical protein